MSEDVLLAETGPPVIRTNRRSVRGRPGPLGRRLAAEAFARGRGGRVLGRRRAAEQQTSRGVVHAIGRGGDGSGSLLRNTPPPLPVGEGPTRSDPQHQNTLTLSSSLPGTAEKLLSDFFEKRSSLGLRVRAGHRDLWSGGSLVYGKSTRLSLLPSSASITLFTTGRYLRVQKAGRGTGGLDVKSKSLKSRCI